MRRTKCPVDNAHKAGSRSCTECGVTVKTPCRFCEKWLSSASVSLHELKCMKRPVQKTAETDKRREEDEDGEEDVENSAKKKKKEKKAVLRVLYVASTRNAELVRGSHFVEEKSASTWLDFCEVTDGRVGGYLVDVYDAIAASLEEECAIEIVATLRNRAQLRDAIAKKETLAEGADLLFWPNWMFESGRDGDKSNMDAVLQWVELLRQYETSQKCLIFPPIDYCHLFGRKELWFGIAQHRFPKTGPFRLIPTHVVFGPWTDREISNVRSLAQKNNALRLVFKRTIGERSERVYDCVDSDLNEQQMAMLKKKGLGKFPFLVQPFLNDFYKFPEYRVYVIDGGEYLFGVQSWIEKGEIKYSSFKEKGCDDEDEARAVACSVAKLFQREANHFLRVDLVRSFEGGWWINELEFFGNAHILLSVHGNEVLARLTKTIKEWINSVYSLSAEEFGWHGSPWRSSCRRRSRSRSTLMRNPGA